MGLNLFDVLCAEVRDTQDGPRAHILLFDPTGKERGTVKGIATPRGKIDARHTTVLTLNVARTLAYILENADAGKLAARLRECIARKAVLDATLTPALTDSKASAAPAESPFRALATPASAKSKPARISTNAPTVATPVAAVKVPAPRA